MRGQRLLSPTDLAGFRRPPGLTGAALLLTIFSGAPLCGQSVRMLELPAEAVSSKVSPPLWSGKFFYVRTYAMEPGQPQVLVYSQSGLALPISISFPDSTTVSVEGVAAVNGGPGALISGSAWSQSGQLATFLAWVDNTGKVTKVIRTNPYLATRICFAPDGSIWTFGVNAENVQADDELVRHFQPDGTLAGKYALKSSFGIKRNPARMNQLGSPFIGVSKDRVGVFSANANQWLEFGFDGQMLGRWTVQPPPALKLDGTSSKPLTVPSLVFRNDNSVYAWLDGGTNSGIYVLDKSGPRWVKVSNIDSRSFAGLFGTQGAELLMRSRQGSGQFAWVSVPSPGE